MVRSYLRHLFFIPCAIVQEYRAVDPSHTIREKTSTTRTKNKEEYKAQVLNSEEIIQSRKHSLSKNLKP